jgi:hypothetical protein
MSDANFWKPAYQVFDPDVPLQTAEELDQFYVQRVNSPTEELAGSLELEKKPAKFLLAGHRGSGKTTELRKLQQELASDYNVIWVDTATALDRFNIGYAEVVALIGFEIYRKAIQADDNWETTKPLQEWGVGENLLKSLQQSLMTVVQEEGSTREAGLGIPEFLQKFGPILKGGLSRKVTSKTDIRPSLTAIIERVNDIIAAAETHTNHRLLVIVDGLDRHDQSTALEMFSDSLLAAPACHIIYTIPISLRYCAGFRRTMEVFEPLDLTNPPVFKCDANGCPTDSADSTGRDFLARAIQKRLQTLDTSYHQIFEADVLTLICEKSGGVMRDLIRLAAIACRIAKQNQKASIDLAIAQAAIKKELGGYTVDDYHFPELAEIHRTGKLSTRMHSLPDRGDFVICDDLLQNKLALGYQDERVGRWFDINPILIEQLRRWQEANNIP